MEEIVIAHTLPTISPMSVKTGPLEGFFTSSVEFCKNVKFDDKDRKDHSRDNNNTGTQGPQVHKVHKVQKVIQEQLEQLVHRVQVLQVHEVPQDLMEQMELMEHQEHQEHQVQQVPQVVTFLNGTNLYRVVTAPVTTVTGVNSTATATCTGNDFAISGDALISINADNIGEVFTSSPTTSGNAWQVVIEGGNGSAQTTFRAVAVCFVNPGP